MIKFNVCKILRFTKSIRALHEYLKNFQRDSCTYQTCNQAIPNVETGLLTQNLAKQGIAKKLFASDLILFSVWFHLFASLPTF